MPARETPLLAAHQAAKAKLVEFAGWRLPLQFSSVAGETKACREAAALFDISHMGLLRLLGPDAHRGTRHVLTRDPRGIPRGCSAYAFLCNDSGGILDDLLAMVESRSSIRLVINAANHDKDVGWLRARLADFEVELEDLRGCTFGLSLQGPRAEEILGSVVEGDLLPDLFATFANLRTAEAEILVSRTGYTGEDGFEVFGWAGDGPRIWEVVTAAGQECGLALAGLAARDVLRQEMGYPLWGQDLDEQTTPLEAGFRWAVDWDGEFIGRGALAESEPTRRRIGFLVKAQGIARSGDAILLAGQEIGRVTSGTYSHNLGAAIGQGYVRASANARPGTEIEVEARGRRLGARIAELPLVSARTRPGWAGAGERKQS